MEGRSQKGGAGKTRKHKRRLAPVGTQERKWQDAIRKAYGLAKKFGKKRKKGGAQRYSRKLSPRQIRKMSELRNQYGGSVVDPQQESIRSNIIKPTSPVVSVMSLGNNTLEDKRDELYPE